MFQKNRFQILIEAGWLKGIFKSGRGLMVLIASMLLMSCGGAATERSMAGSDESAAEETAMNTTTAAETPISSEAAAESADRIAFSLGSRSISTGAALYTLLQQKQYYESVSSSYYSSEMTAEDWQEIQSDGNTLAQNLTRSVWDTLCDDLAAAGYADANGIVLTEQESSGAEQKAREEYAAIPETDRTLTGLQEPDWISQKQLEALYEKVKEQVSGSYQKKITDDEARTMRYYVFAVSLDGTDGVDGLPTQEEAERRMEEIFARADAGEDIAAVAKEYGYNGMEDSLSVGVYDRDENAVRALTLAAGESMTFLSDEHTLCGIYCLDAQDAELTAQRKEQMQEEAREEYFRGLLDQWKAEAEICENIGRDAFSRIL